MMNHLQRSCRKSWLATAILFSMLSSLGCSREYYRLWADRDANATIAQKAWQVDADTAELNIRVDPRSRMYDPNNPDDPPMPIDDPTSYRIMECVDGKRGARRWERSPRTPFAENPIWQCYLPRNEDGKIVLDLRGAVQLALLNSTDYQQELEELYLSALDVTFERFRFDAQFFGGSEIFFTADGRNRSGTGNSSSLLEVSPFSPDNRLRVEKLSATGGELVVGLANSLVWQFSGPDNYSSSTVLDFALVQPLLRGAGRVRVLERLTIAERALLANVRAMERYRRGFYLNVVTGREPEQGVSRRGGFFGGSGLEGFAGVGGGGFGNVGFFGQGGGGGFGGPGGGQGGGFTGGAGASGAGGYLGLLQFEQIIRNQRANIAALRESVEQLQASQDAGRIDRFQVDLARQALYNVQSQLLISEQQYQDFLENFKVDFGLPPELPIEIADPLLDRFNLLDPKLSELQTQVSDTLSAVRELRTGDLDEPSALAPPLPGEQALDGRRLGPITAEQLAPLLVLSQDIGPAVELQLEVVEQDLLQLQAALPERRETLLQLANRPEVRDVQIDPLVFSVEALDDRMAALSRDVPILSQKLRRSLERLQEVTSATDLPAEQQSLALVETLSDLSSLLLELSVAQARARLDAVYFQPTSLQPEQALAIASVYRRDWMNARASLVDSWRLIFFNANDLRSGLDLVFSGDIGNVGDNPTRLRSSNGRLRVGLEFDSALTRLAERNVYRQSLIEFQQAQRSYYEFRDRVYQGLRQELRQMRLNEINFELRRAAVLVAIAQVDITQLRLSEPPQPSAPGATTGPVAQFGDTTARDLVQALSDLLNVQNDFLSVWVNHEVQQLQLDYDLGIMELDENGLLIERDVPLETYLINLKVHPWDLRPGMACMGECPAFEEILPEEVPSIRSLPDGVESHEREPLPLPPLDDYHADLPIMIDERVVQASAEGDWPPLSLPIGQMVPHEPPPRPRVLPTGRASYR